MIEKIRNFLRDQEDRRLDRFIDKETKALSKLHPADEGPKNAQLREEMFPASAKAHPIDPALLSMLGQQVREGRLTQEAFDAELKKYDPPQNPRDDE